ncbi:MAG: fibronectin type III domain-containing protein, partial [Burkholderiaceae bacterium]|nr:fibronectin type III domain-containing protein [Burkholderiaceae bacterium]
MLATLLATLFAAVFAAGCGNDSVTLFGSASDAPETIVLTATADGATRALLSWAGPSGDFAFRVERNATAVGDTESMTFVDTRLAAGQRYCWRVYARNGFGWQAKSNEACLGTAPTTQGWRVERLAAGRWPALAIDARGELHACFAGAGGLGIAYLRVAPGRTPETVDADGQAQCALAVGADGVVHVAYLSRFGLRYANRSASGWATSTVDAQALVGIRRFDGPAIALAADGTPRIAYRRPTSGGPVALTVALRERSGWTFDPTTIAGLVGPRSLAVDASGVLRLATTDDLGQSVVAWVRQPRGWVSEHSESLAPNAGDGPPIARAAGARARIAGWGRAAPTTATEVTLRWSEATASVWRTESRAPPPRRRAPRPLRGGGGHPPGGAGHGAGGGPRGAAGAGGRAGG